MKMVITAKIIKKEHKTKGIILNQTNLVTHPAKRKHTYDPNVWHGFIVHASENVQKSRILQNIVEYLYPHELIPLGFERLGNGNDYMFIARDCAEAIHALCRCNLMIPDPVDPNHPFVFELILAYSNVNELNINITERIRPILQNLTDPIKKMLNLDSFLKNKDTPDYLSLSIPKVLYDVLSAATTIHQFHFNSITMKDNGISSLDALEVLWKFTHLQHLDLRKNKIEDLSTFSCIKNLKLTSIDLDGNPICEKMDEYTYVAELRNIFPSLKIIDGQVIQRDGVPIFHKNYLCDPSTFVNVDNFIETYFNLFDRDRKSLEDLYHPNGMFSMTNMYRIGQTTSNDARLRPYQMNCRNLLSMADVARSHQYLLRGNKTITRKLLDLPQVEHDLFNFKIDVIFNSEKSMIINVCGVFREHLESVLASERYLGFSRTFALANYNGNYLIINDMFHVYNALSHQVSVSFRVARPVLNFKLPLPDHWKDKIRAIQVFKVVTGLSNSWSKRFLETNNYDMVEGIKSFMDMYKIDKIPQEAFKEETTQEIN